MGVELTERVGKLEVAQARVEERADGLESTVKEVKEKVDKLQYWIMGIMAATLVSLFVNLFK